MRKNHLKQVTLIKDQERIGIVMNIRELELCTNYYKIQIPPKVDELLLGIRIEYLSELELDYEMEEGVNKDLCWCSGIV